MAEIRWTHQAADDFEEIVGFIGQNSRNDARRFAKSLLIAVDRLAIFPKSGRVVPEVGNESIREVIYRSYRIIYRTKSDCVEILTIYHGARLLDSRHCR